MGENYYHESVYCKELHNLLNDQEYNWPTIYRAGVAVVSTITNSSIFTCIQEQKVKISRNSSITPYLTLILILALRFYYCSLFSLAFRDMWRKNVAFIKAFWKRFEIKGWQNHERLSMYIINTIPRGKCCVLTVFTHPLCCIRNLTRSLRSLARFLIITSGNLCVKPYARQFHELFSV